MKKALSLFAALLMVFGMMAGTASAADSEPITIQFWNSFTGSDGDILREIVNRFNAENEYGITIEMDIMPGATLTEKLAPAITTGTAPALILSGNFDVPMHAVNGTMLPMDDFFDLMSTDKDDFMPAALESLQYNGSQIMIPMQWFTTYLYYNKDVFEAAGLDPEVAPDTWDEVAEFAATITAADPNVFGMGFCVSGGVSWFNALFLANGGQVLDTVDKKSQLDSPENLASLQYVQGMTQSGSAPIGNTGADLDNLMMADRLGMVINGPWMVNGLKENEINFGVAYMPAGSADRVGIAETSGFAIPKGTSDEAKMAAYRFVEYWNTTAICKEWSMRNGFPPYLNSVAGDPEVQADPLVSVFSGIAEYGTTFGSGLTTTTQIIANVEFPMIENVIAGQDCQTELTNASQAIDEILATEP